MWDSRNPLGMDFLLRAHGTTWNSQLKDEIMLHITNILQLPECRWKSTVGIGMA